MKKSTKIIIAIIIIVAVIASIVVALVMNSKPKNEEKKSELPAINSAKDLAALVDKMYEGQTNLYPTLETRIIDLSKESDISFVTGIESAEDFEFLVASEPMISSQPYSLILAKVKSGKDANEVAKKIFENVNPRKWICVSPEVMYATSSGDIVCFIMSKEEMAKPVYEKFKELSVNYGQEYTQVVKEELPTEPDTEFPGQIVF